MKRRGKKASAKKGMAVLLTALMTAGIFLGMPKQMEAVWAADLPSVTAYATTDDLETAFDCDGTNDTVGKLVFGKNESGKPQEWYILGKESGRAGNNTTLFAASNIINECHFQSDYLSDPVSYSSDWGCVYTGTVPSQVDIGHYGRSNVRSRLTSIASNSAYFTTGEQALMEATTISTEDKQNSSSYTTSDKLYLLHGTWRGTEVYAGGDNGKTIASSYWNGGNFFLRTPYNTETFQRLYANKNQKVEVTREKSGVRPAANLDLTNVLFASSAKAAVTGTESGRITEGTAMTLRLNGSNMNKNIGTVVYNGSSGRIFAQKDKSATETVSLVVQGKDGTTDWYYSQVVDDTEVLEASRIKTALGLTSDIMLSDCQIWMEMTETDNLSYAVSARAITAVETPTASVPAGTYTKNQTIELSTATEGADIYYTTDGSLPSVSNGTKYKNAITVTGTEGKSVTTTIKAIAVRKDFEDSAVSTFEYKINLEKPQVTYQIIEGAEGSYRSNEDGSYMIRANADLEKFVNVWVDGTLVPEKYYQLKSGSTIITFTAEYMNSLTAGTHTITMNFTDGTAQTSVIVSKAAETGNTNSNQSQKASPKTGESENTVFCMLVLMAVVATTMTITKQKRFSR